MPSQKNSGKGTRPNIGIGSHRCLSIGNPFFPIPLIVGPDIIGTEWNGIGNGSQLLFFIRPINNGHQKKLAAQVTHHKSKSKSVNVVFRCTNTLKFQFKCCRPADKVFLLIINLIFLINVSCLKRNLTSQCRTFVCISYDRTYDQKILNLCIKETAGHSFEWKTAQCTLEGYDLKMIILKQLVPVLTGTQNELL